MRTRYIVMKSSEQTNTKGIAYPDVLTLPFKKMIFKDSLKKVQINQIYKEKFYLLCYEEYGVTYYDDIVLWINGISSTHAITPGEYVYLPSKEDIERFLVDHETTN
jgi:hypothetical protein